MTTTKSGSRKKKPAGEKKTQKITLQMTFGEVLAQNPEAADIMLSYGLHCVGCGISELETIEQGAMMHGLTKMELRSLLKDLNALGPTGKINKQKGVAITDKALRKIKQLQLMEEKIGWPLQVSFITQPNDEKEFFLEFVPTPDKKKEILTFGSTTLLFAPDDLSDVQGLEIDFDQTEEGEGFLFKEGNEI